MVRAISEDGEAGNLPRFDVSREILPRCEMGSTLQVDPAPALREVVSSVFWDS